MIDRILLNGNIYTLDKNNSRATALAIIGERIVAIGSDDEIRALAGRDTQIDNLNGQFVIPGLTDAHIHWENTAKSRHSISLYNVPSKQEALRRIEAQAKTLKPGLWIFGSGWAQDDWEDR